MDLDFIAGRSKCEKGTRGYSIEETNVGGYSGNYENRSILTEAHKGELGKFPPKEDREVEKGR